MAFEVREALPTQIWGRMRDSRVVIDPEKDAWIQRVGTLGRNGYVLFRFVWNGRIIPFEATFRRHQQKDGQEYSYWTISTFGESEREYWRHSGPNFPSCYMPPYRFESEEEKETAVITAAEALLAYGRFYDGSDWEDGSLRVVLRNKELRKSDFRPESKQS